jgi:hypothetical protein
LLAIGSGAGLILGVLASRVLASLVYEATPRDPLVLAGVVTDEPRHLLRAIPPSCLDIIFGQRLGTLAVENALAGYTDFMISQWLTEYVLVPLQLAVLGRKRIPRTGIFWKSVLAKTGQPANLDLRPTPRERSSQPTTSTATLSGRSFPCSLGKFKRHSHRGGRIPKR